MHSGGLFESIKCQLIQAVFFSVKEGERLFKKGTLVFRGERER